MLDGAVKGEVKSGVRPSSSPMQWCPNNCPPHDSFSSVSSRFSAASCGDQTPVLDPLLPPVPRCSGLPTYGNASPLSNTKWGIPSLLVLKADSTQVAKLSAASSGRTEVTVLSIAIFLYCTANP